MKKIWLEGMFCLALGVSALGAHAQTTIRLSESAGGIQATGISRRGAISNDGLYTAFVSVAPELVPGDTNGVEDVFVRDNDTGEIVSVGVGGVQGNEKSDRPTISADGRFVAFSSKASNLVVGDSQTFDMNQCPTCTGWQDVFVRDRNPDANGIFDEGNGHTTRVSVSTSGTPTDRGCQGIRISGDGLNISFDST